MALTASVAVIIPTFGRGTRVFEALEKVLACDPVPSEIWVHVDQSDGGLESAIAARFPSVNVIASGGRLGPGGGRHLCLCRCSAEIAVSLDDDSYPVDPDFFERVARLFAANPDAAVIGASIWHRRQSEVAISPALTRSPSYIGCGHALRLSAYRGVSGYVPRPVAYGLEETDVALQLFAKGCNIYESGELRVFHDTELRHHQSPEITECVVANVALLAWLRYPPWLWTWALLQLCSVIVFCVRVGRWRGIVPGLIRIPRDCVEFRRFRKTLPSRSVIGYLKFRRG